ncbi:hypothetical protein [Bifidobacterium breve]|uniref:hypothetical protein n=1 Tax=Bifidobacterium breve TaxID=1685 RepID=UPI001146E7E5|nr:hypothetical protein [Bifidobacterium breve]
MAANQEFAWGLLDSRRYNKYKMRLEAFVEEKLDRAVAGSLTPGTEVIFSRSFEAWGRANVRVSLASRCA